MDNQTNEFDIPVTRSGDTPQNLPTEPDPQPEPQPDPQPDPQPEPQPEGEPTPEPKEDKQAEQEEARKKNLQDQLINRAQPGDTDRMRDMRESLERKLQTKSIKEISEEEGIDPDEAAGIRDSQREHNKGIIDRIIDSRMRDEHDDIKVKLEYPQFDKDSSEYDADLDKLASDFYNSHHKMELTDPSSKETYNQNGKYDLYKTLADISKSYQEKGFQEGSEAQKKATKTTETQVQSQQTKEVVTDTDRGDTPPKQPTFADGIKTAFDRINT